jgi:hypothetical protein
LITFDREAVLAFVAPQIPGGDRGFGTCQCIGFTDAEGRVEAGFVYHNWHPEAGVIEITSAIAPGWRCTRGKMAEVMGYPFRFCRMVVWRTSEANRGARRILRGIGAREYLIPDLHAPGVAEAIYTMTADQWRATPYARCGNGQAVTTDATRPEGHVCGADRDQCQHVHRQQHHESDEPGGADRLSDLLRAGAGWPPHAAESVA